MSLSVILSELEANKVDYSFIEHNLKSQIVNPNPSSINVVIPIMGRKDFLPPLHKSLINAIKNVDICVNITVVEISEVSEHYNYCAISNINYFWLDINLLIGESKVFNKGFNGIKLFNKSLAMNIGAIFSPKSKYLLFHDVDCLVKSDFFINLLSNIQVKKAKALQCFQLRRVLYLNEVITHRILQSELEIDSLSSSFEGVTPPTLFGAPGGSIILESELFYDIGGYDPELFSGYSTEDAFFWDKLSSVCEIHLSDNPPIDIFHMNHALTHHTNPLFNQMHTIWSIFNNLNINERLEYINVKRDKYQLYYE